MVQTSVTVKLAWTFKVRGTFRLSFEISLATGLSIAKWLISVAVDTPMIVSIRSFDLFGIRNNVMELGS